MIRLNAEPPAGRDFAPFEDMREEKYFVAIGPDGGSDDALKRVQVSGAAKYRDMPDKNDYSHVAESLQYLLVGGGEARLLVKRTQRGVRPELAVME